MAKPKYRVDELLALRGLAESRERAKRLATRLATASSAIEELLDFIKIDSALNGDFQLLQAGLFALQSYTKACRNAVDAGKESRAAAERRVARDRQNRISAAVQHLFGTQTPSEDQVRQLADQLVEFSRSGKECLLKRHPGAKGAYFFTGPIDLEWEGRKGPLTAVQIAEAYLEASRPGRMSEYDGEPHYYAGWSDFEAWLKSR